MGNIEPLGAATDNTTVYGGKAAALGSLLQAGFTVPEGFALAVHAVTADLKTLEKELLQAFDALKLSKVAVRSSAIAEDSKSASWAGQLETFLNIEREQLLEQIQKCWASAHSSRALSYAKQHNTSDGGVAVIVQRMIQSEVSGIAFSIHPVTQNESQIVIEAGMGLGEAIVSGEITPDMYVVTKTNLEILEKEISGQDRQLTEQGWIGTGSGGNQQKLSDKYIAGLSKIVRKLEGYWGYPVDVEWALEKGKLYITQCRPVTTLEQPKDTQL